MPATELSGPLPPEQFTQTLHSRHHGTEVGIRGDTDGSAFGITLPPSGDEATFGSATLDSICKVGGYPLIIPATTPHSLEIPPALTGGTTGRTDLVVARYAPATYTTAPGPVRLTRIEGTPGSLTVPSYNAATDLPLWSVRRRQGEALNQAIPGDLRSWTGRMILVKSGAALPLQAPLGSRATRDSITYRRDFVGSDVDWVEESWGTEVISGSSAVQAVSGSGWARDSTCRLVRKGDDRFGHFVFGRGGGTDGGSIAANGSGWFAGQTMAKLQDQDKPPSGVNVTLVGRAVIGTRSYMATAMATSAGDVVLFSLAPNVTLEPGDTVTIDGYWSVA